MTSDTTRRAGEATRRDDSVPESTSKPHEPSTNAETKRRLKALRSLPVTDESCKVPGCKSGRLDGLDCCYAHCLNDAHNGEGTAPNDGIVDDIAIEIAMQGARPVRLTCVEKNIALAKLVKSGIPLYTAADQLGLSHSALSRGRRAAEVASILEALDG